MIHFHCYQHEPIKYDTAFDPATGSIGVSGVITPTITLTVAAIRGRYGGDALLIYVYSDDSGNVATGVFPDDGKALSDARRAFLKQQWASGRLLLMAEIPAGAANWTDPGVRVVSIYSYTDLTTKGHEIDVAANEPDLKPDDFAIYLQDNPLRIAWAIEKGTVIHAKAV